MRSEIETAVRVLPVFVFFWQLFGASKTFRPAGPTSPLSSLISIGFAVLIIRSSYVPLIAWRAAIGCGGLAAALALFEWARRSIGDRHFSYIFSDDTPTFLLTAGPYAYIRNPFYSSYILSMASTALMFSTIVRWLVVVSAVVYFSFAAAFEERKFTRGALAREYAEYKRRTGRFVPRVKSHDAELH